MRRELGLVVVVAGVITGCASTNVTRVKPNDYTAKGVRYWLSAPYLLVTMPVQVSKNEELFLWHVGTKTYEPFKATDSSKDVAAAPAPQLVDSPKVAARRDAPAKAGGKADEKAAEKGGSDAQKDDKEKSGGEASSSTEPASPSGALSIVWLPDYCHQYALDQSNTLSTQSMKLKLANGWQLDNIEDSTDSTAMGTKVLDVVAAAIGAIKDVRVARIDAEKKSEKKEGGEESGVRRIAKRTTVKLLKPGVYPLFKRKDDTCDAAPTISISDIPYETSQTWIEVAPVSPSSSTKPEWQ